MKFQCHVLCLRKWLQSTDQLKTHDSLDFGVVVFYFKSHLEWLIRNPINVASTETQLLNLKMQCWAILFFNISTRPLFLKWKDQNIYQSFKLPPLQWFYLQQARIGTWRVNVNFILVGERQCLPRESNPRPCAPRGEWLFLASFFRHFGALVL